MKRKSVAVLFLLIIIVVFIIGVRYGSHVEQTNKAVNYILSLPPTKPPVPTLSKEFKTFAHKECGVSFLYPAWIQTIKETTISAVFEQKSKKLIVITCRTKSSSDSANIGMSFFQKTNTTTKKTVNFFVDNSLAPLVEKTVEFNPPQ